MFRRLNPFILHLFDINKKLKYRFFLIGMWSSNKDPSRHTTSFQRLYDVYTTSLTSCRRRIDVETTSCVYWDIPDTAVTIFSMTEAMLMKLQVSFKNYLGFSVDNKSIKRGMYQILKYAVSGNKTATI